MVAVKCKQNEQNQKHNSNSDKPEKVGYRLRTEFLLLIGRDICWLMLNDWMNVEWVPFFMKMELIQRYFEERYSYALIVDMLRTYSILA